MHKFDQSLPMMLRRALDSVLPKYREVFNQHDISEQQWRILRVLWEENNLTTSDLAKKTQLPAPSMVGVIDRMITKELLQRNRDKKDRRVVYVSLTCQGEALLQALIPKIDDIYQQIIISCDPESWTTMLNTLQTIIDTQNKQIHNTKNETNNEVYA